MFNKNKIIGLNRNLKNLQFKIGDVLEVKYESKQGYWSIKTFTGICIVKKNKGGNTKITLRNVIDDVSVEYDFFCYGSDVVDIQRLYTIKGFNINKGKLYFLRNANKNKSKVI